MNQLTDSLKATFKPKSLLKKDDKSLPFELGDGVLPPWTVPLALCGMHKPFDKNT